MQAIEHFLTSYSGNFKMALALWPVFAFFLTLPILAYLYHRDGRLRFVSTAATYLTVLYGLGLVCFTLYPLPSGDAGPGITYGVPPQFNPLGFVRDIQTDGLKAVFQLAFNVVFFMPLGFIAGRLLRMRFPSTLLLAVITSVLIETAQLTGLFGAYPYAYRCCDVDDVLTNVLGAVLGWLCAYALGAKVAPGSMPEIPVTDHPGFVRRCVALWLDLMVVWLVAFVPWMLISLATELAFDQAITLPGMSAVDTFSTLVGGCALAALVVVEVVIPWLRDGSTPGGSFVRMTFETHPRTLGYRIVFYVARSITLVAALVFAPALMLVLALFYLITRRMPYDYIP